MKYKKKKTFLEVCIYEILQNSKISLVYIDIKF